MTRFGIYSLAVLLFFAAGKRTLAAEDNSEAPGFQEVYQLIRSNAPGISNDELNRAAVQGLVLVLSPKVQLVTNEPPDGVASGDLSRTALFEDHIGYLRVSTVSGNLAEKIRQAHEDFNSSNKLTGLVLDLRYAGGSDYAAAGAAASLFIPKARPLLDWGQGVFSSDQKSNAIQLPLAILVNSGTSGSAEALAAALRSTGAGLVLGSKTAGHALIAKDFPLTDGSKLRLATSPVLLGNGTPVSTNGIKPDIDVTVDPDEERSYYADAFVLLPRTGQLAGTDGSDNPLNRTNATRRARFGEAELVREHRQSLDRDQEELDRARESEPEKPLVSDPALARALDLLKGLAVVRQSRP